VLATYVFVATSKRSSFCGPGHDVPGRIGYEDATWRRRIGHVREVVLLVTLRERRVIRVDLEVVAEQLAVARRGPVFDLAGLHEFALFGHKSAP
jgi:hypothetical protein